MVSDHVEGDNYVTTQGVLILVVMEYGLRHLMNFVEVTIFVIMSLNPCCNGIWSQTLLGFCRGLNDAFVS